VLLACSSVRVLLGSLAFSSETVEVKVEVVLTEAASSTSLAGWAFLALGEAGWKRVGGSSFGKRLDRWAGSPKGIVNK